MLLLSRRRNESIQIGDDITILVVEIRGDKVRLGIGAPQETKIWRTEIAPEKDNQQVSGE
jgi:carbon storage regulator